MRIYFNYLVGDLTIRGETHEVELDVEFQGMARSPWGTMSAGFSAWTTLNRKEQFTKHLNQQGNLCNTGWMDVSTSIQPVYFTSSIQNPSFADTVRISERRYPPLRPGRPPRPMG